MGTFGTGILDNDTSREVYNKFVEHLENGLAIPKVVDEINSQFKEYKKGDSKTDFIFALGLALWENCSLDQKTLTEIKKYIELGVDIDIWGKLEGSEEDIKQRKKELKKFLKKIEVPRKNPLKKQKKITIYKPPIFKTGDCVCFKLSNGNYSGGIVLGEHKIDKKEMGSNVIISTDINQLNKPIKEDFFKSNVLITNFGDLKNWVEVSEYSSDFFIDFNGEIEVVNSIEIKEEIQNYFSDNFCGYSHWNFLITNIENELSRKPVRRKIKTLSIKDILIDLKLKETRNRI
ncbi:hypothetical protein AX016_0660 [Cellulophaga sp. RHA19]|uniref:hypothetical protein n=1 Tax=Cellulophaga sp. RHA19 TaxID=1798237 RepID=UPI000C2CDEBC|nr:hypothetical protein [Cellulophaga sp. RHA19]PKB42493.1 hypothetical protein AX016_0660 [Cellulophaga sp. RHA19]